MWLLWLAFFCSGVAGLSYELTWVHYLAQLFGAATPAVSATVSIFFTGMALGAALGGRWLDRCRRPLLAYAWLELSIGVCALFVPAFFGFAEQTLAKQLSQGSGHPLLLLGISTCILLVPTTLLGATFPAMAAVVRHFENPTFSTGFFYGFNTLGAVCGCVFVSFVLLPTVGQSQTTWMMALTNGLIALLLWLAYRRFPTLSHPSQEKEPTGEPVPSVTSRTITGSVSRCSQGAQITRIPAMVMAGGSGFLAIGIEVLWTRALCLSFPSSRYVFALVLAAYLVGIGIGAVMVGWVFRSREAHRTHLLGMYLCIAVGSVTTMLLFPRLMPWCASLIQGGSLLTWEGSMAWLGTAAVLSMLPATLAMGAALPLLIGLATKGLDDASQTAGRLYAINTIGGVFGSFVLGFYALPYLGLSRALFALSLGYVLLAAFVSLVRRNTVAWRALVFASMATGVLMLAGDTIPELDQQRHKSTQTTLHHQDTSSATYTVYESKRGSRSLLVNNQKGLRDSSYRIAAVQAQLGHLSVLLANQPKRALLFGFGTGVELAAMAHHPLSQVDCVALQGQTVVSLSSFFSQANLQMKWKRPAYKKTGIRIFEGDGRRTLLRKGPAYDLVVSSLPLPEQAGVGALLSHEQFQAVKRRLSDRGMFVLWLPLHRWGTRELAVVTRTFLASFPDAKAWLGTWSKTLPVLGLIGWKKQFHPISAPYARSVKESLRRWRHHYSREYFGRQAATTDLLTMSGSLSLHARMWISTDVLQMVSHSAALNRLERPVIELMAPRSLFRVRSHPHSLLREHIRLFRRHGALLSTPWSVSLR